MSLPVTNVEVGEVRRDPADLKDYIWNGSAWVLKGAGTPSSADFPDGDTVGEERSDVETGATYRWSGSAWSLVTRAGEDADQDNVTDHAELADVATNVAGGNATTLKGSLPYNAAADTTTMLPPNTTVTKKFLAQTGNGTNGDAPEWATLDAEDVPNDAINTDRLKYVQYTVSIAAGTSGTATVTAGSVILGYHVTAVTGTERVKTVDIASTTLTVTLTGSDTATVVVTVLEA